MPTSNKILASFLLLVFLSPLLLFLAFKGKIKANEYVVVNASEDMRKQNLTKIAQPKSLVIEGVPCVIIPSDSPAYETDNVGKDIRIVEEGDTLKIFFSANHRDNAEGVKSYFGPLRIYLPVIPFLRIDGAELRIDSIHTPMNPLINADIKNNAKLNIGTESGWVVSQKSNEGEAQYKAFQSLNVRMENSELNIGSSIQIGSLQIEGIGKSAVNVSSQSQIAQVSANLSDSCMLNATWDFTRKIQSSTNSIKQ